MSQKRKNLVITSVILSVLIILVAMVVLFKKTDTSKNSVKIIEYGFSTCTQDVPSSSCGPYDVTVEFSNGTKSVYKVPGYGEDANERDQYQRISSQIYHAKENKASIVLELNNKNEIISTH